MISINKTKIRFDRESLLRDFDCIRRIRKNSNITTIAKPKPTRVCSIWSPNI